MKKLFMRVLIVCALVSIASTTQAGLTHVNDDDFNALVSQEYEITRDSDTNLDWLDVDAYTNVSWDAVEALLGTGGHILEDWRHATRDEVGVYFGNLGLLVGNYPGVTADFDSGVRGNAAEAFTGHTETGPGAEENRAYAFSATLSDVSRAYLPLFIFDSRSHTGGSNVGAINTPYSEVGHWLVRTSPAELVVPEPSTFSMLAFCGLAMAGYSRLRRRRK